MSRSLTSAVQTESEASVVTPFLLAELLFTNDPVRVWNGIGPLSWDGKTWQGVGDLGGVDPIQETSSLKVTGVQFTLSGIPSDTLSLVLQADYHGNLAKLYLGFFDASENIISDPFVIREGFMDQMIIDEGGETSQVTVKAESRLISLQRPKELIYDRADQQTIHSGDKGFDFVPSLQDKEIAWGVGAKGNGKQGRVINDQPTGTPAGPGGSGTVVGGRGGNPSGSQTIR